MKVKRYIVVIILIFMSSITDTQGREWCVQVSSFRHLKGIKQDFQKVRTLKNARIVKVNGLYSIRIGHFDTLDQAKEELKVIQDKFPGAFVRKSANEQGRIIAYSQPPKTKAAAKSTDRQIDKAVVKITSPPPTQPESSSDPLNNPSQPSAGYTSPAGGQKDDMIAPPAGKDPDTVIDTATKPETLSGVALLPELIKAPGPTPEPTPESMKEKSEALSTISKSTASDTANVPVTLVKAAAPTIPNTEASANQTQPLQMSLAEAVALNLRRNVGIKLAYMDRVQQKYDFITGYYYAYQPKVSVGLEEKRIRFDDTNNLTGVVTKGEVRTDTALINVDTKLPTGTRFIFALPQWNETKRTIDAPGSGYTESLTRSRTWGVSFTQPLLKGAGIDYHTAAPKIAKMTEDVNKLTLKSAVNTQVRQIIQAYRTFLRAKWNVEINRASLQRSFDLLAINKFQIELGTMAPEDVVQSESDVANNQLQLEDAINSYENARISLLIILDMNKDTVIEPVESLETPPFLLDEARCLSVLYENQPPYLTSLLNLEMTKLNTMMVKRDSLWDLNLTGNFGETTYGGTASEGKQTDKGIGLSLNIPLYGSDARALRSAVLQAENNLKKAEVNLRKLKDDIVLVVRDKVRNIQILQKKVDMAVRASELGLRKLENEKEKLVAGRSSNFQLTTYQDQLKTTQINELQVKIDYLNALTDLDDYLGTTTETWNIDINDEKREEGPRFKSTAIQYKKNPGN